MGNAREYILEMENINKTFPGVQALSNVSVKIQKGIVHALTGENGAGKSTLMKILAGIYQMDSGNIILNSKPINLNNPSAALNNGIAMVHQELSPIPDLSVAENIFVGRELVYKHTHLVDRKTMNRKVKDIFNDLNIYIDPKKRIGDLSIAEIQMVEIVKAISYNAEILILDEPTSAISETEVKKLFRIIRTYTERGQSVIYISHKMDEIFEISDEITVLRDGKYIDTKKTQDVSEENLIRMMVGRSLDDFFPKTIANKGDIALRVENLSLSGKFKNISFEAKQGEILGIAGLMGAGRSELVESIFAVHPPDTGKIYLNGKEVRFKSPKDAIENGFALITEDRKITGLNLKASVKSNMSIVSLNDLSKFLTIIDKKKEVSLVDSLIRKLSIKTPNRNTSISSLSGGNQQKVVIAKWLLSNPDILILDEPTRGIDVGTKAEVHKLMNKFTEEGKTVIMISSELPELIGMSDRIIVMLNGVLTGRFKRCEFDQGKILTCAMNQVGREGEYESYVK